MCFLSPEKRKKLAFSHKLGLLRTSAELVQVRCALGDSSAQKHSSSAPVAPVCTGCRFVPAESCHAPGEFLGTASAVPGSLTPHCCKKPKQGLLEGSTVEVRG